MGMYKIYNRYFSLSHFVMVLTEIILLVFVTTISNLVEYSNNSVLIVFSPIVNISLMTIFYVLSLYYVDFFSSAEFRLNRQMVQNFFLAIICSTIILFCFSFFFTASELNRQALIYNLVLLPLCLLTWRQFFTKVISLSFPSKRILILGTGELAKKVANETLRWYGRGWDLTGFIDNQNFEQQKRDLSTIDRRREKTEIRNDTPRRKASVTVVGGYGDILDIVSSENIKKIIVCVEDRRSRLPMYALLDCKLKGVQVIEGEIFLERGTGKIPVQQIKPSWLVFSEGFKSLRSRKRVKRLFDIIFSLVGLVLSTPICLVGAVLIKMESKGPIVYTQDRVGEKGKEFKIYKFRSMKQNAETRSGPVWAKEGDSRITKVGGFLRRTRIDEIPQLVNVLRGEMSLVGPRPERKFFVEELRKTIPYYNMRSFVKPGLTGWAQTNYRYGATDEDAIEKLQFDLFYIKHMSLCLDVIIMLKTIKTVIGRKGAV